MMQAFSQTCAFAQLSLMTQVLPFMVGHGFSEEIESLPPKV